MEDNILDNKASELNKEFHKGVKGMSKFVVQGLKTAKKLEADLFAQMTNSEISKLNAFKKKYNKLYADGEFLEANNLKETYLNEQL